MWRALAVLAFLATAQCNPVAGDSVDENLVGAIYECVEKDTSLCLKVGTQLRTASRRSEGERTTIRREDSQQRRPWKKKKKKIKQLLPLLILLKLKLAALVPLFLGIIAFVAVKALFLGKIAFAMSAISLIRKLLAKNQSSGWTSSPHEHHDAHPGYSYEPAQGWSRKASDAQSLAYAGQLRK
ncbi:hypothetical protein EVAR_12292_1 [Eumeta japonica]|uniref:Osiris 9 n=1 Tax=Eumeta variegata TaxID=151549 RepID=A0A4C1TU83_EUMVA|nr:hypothetical protein EVAR_12292_1 [Eumeta japonica]